jgi:hypothetical protein
MALTLMAGGFLTRLGKKLLRSPGTWTICPTTTYLTECKWFNLTPSAPELDNWMV